jgi:DNA-directed RNA polymerase subunit RPC12/RpoP
MNERESQPPSYSAYLKSAAWKKFKASIFSTRGHRCERCGFDRMMLHLHHKTYVRLGREQPEDVKILCVSCHDLEDNERRISAKAAAKERNEDFFYTCRLMGWARKVKHWNEHSNWDVQSYSKEFDAWCERREE